MILININKLALLYRKTDLGKLCIVSKANFPDSWWEDSTIVVKEILSGREIKKQMPDLWKDYDYGKLFYDDQFVVFYDKLNLFGEDEELV